jgi:hypothetical protein
MAFSLKKLFTGTVSETLGAAGEFSKDIREAIKGKEEDPNKQLDLISKSIEIQAKINEVEAQHRSIFVAGWRPAIGWVCGIALAYNFIVRDVFIWAIDPEVIPPALQMDHLMTVLVGLLGLGGMRTYEKIKGKAK